ncbi:MAG: M15 family metallopeptidase [Ignavibacteriae bacterium]|nr:M15 family metallopeptidase [Ignavibacteriota bacterium]
MASNTPSLSTHRHSTRTRWLVVCVVVVLCSPTFSQSHKDESNDLVEIVKLDSTVRIDVRYASTNNFMKRKMYSQARVFLQRPAAEALMRAHAKIRKAGFGLLLFDGYRPWSVTKKFWDETPPAQRKYVANPKYGSKHNRGCAIDLSLYDLRTGKEVAMQTEYDNFTTKAAADYPGATDAQRRLRWILRDAMESEGFKVNPDEWWHFDYKDWRNYRVLDIPFEQLK